MTCITVSGPMGKTWHRLYNQAVEALDTIKPDDSDMAIASVVADYLLVMLRQRRYHLSISHDVRPSTARRVEKWRKELGQPDYAPAEPFGPCPVDFDWQYKNSVGITTTDRKRARRWIIDAMLAGYGVFRCYRKGGSGGGQGSLAAIRKRR